MQIDHKANASESVVLASPESQQIDAAFFKTEILETGDFEDQVVSVPRSTVDALCGDDDGCTMRLVFIAAGMLNPGPLRGDSRWFGIREFGQWRAETPGISGTGEFASGSIAADPHEVVLRKSGTGGTCELRDDNGTNEFGFPYQRLEVLAEATDSPAEDSFHCLLRIDD